MTFVNNGVKKSTGSFTSLESIVSMALAIFVSRFLRRFLISVSLKRKFSFRFEEAFFTIRNIWFIGYTYFLFNKQLGLALRPQSCLYFKGFRCSKLLNGCLLVRLRKLCLRGMQLFSGFKIDIHDKWFWNFPSNAFETAGF